MGDLSELFQQVFIAAVASVGIVELLKNFIKTKRTWVYSLIMIPVALGCYASCLCLPKAVIGGILTVGVVQNGYQLVIQTVKNIFTGIAQKAGGSGNTESSANGGSTNDNN